ncbi:Pepco domain-containing protein [Streptomyces sp. URMC 129]|uniref:Pepco domain-containing protein n=1 Tax=Streptomyces sp. URMC 129 TaxID=3423407 RepID=UPI003F1C078E
MPQQFPDRSDADRDAMVRVLALEDSDDRSLFRRPQDWRIGRTDIPVEVFRQRVTDFLTSMRSVIAGLPSACEGYELDQVTVSAEVSAKGHISLLGSGGELAGTSSLTFTFTRRVPSAPQPEAAGENPG